MGWVKTPSIWGAMPWQNLLFKSCMSMKGARDNRIGLSLWLLRSWKTISRSQIRHLAYSTSQYRLRRYDTRKVFAPMTFIGFCNLNLFQMWLEQCLLPQLQTGDVIVINNARHFSDDSVTRKDAFPPLPDNWWDDGRGWMWVIVSSPLLSRLEQDRALVVCTQKLDAAEVERIW